MLNFIIQLCKIFKLWSGFYNNNNNKPLFIQSQLRGYILIFSEDLCANLSCRLFDAYSCMDKQISEQHLFKRMISTPRTHFYCLVGNSCKDLSCWRESRWTGKVNRKRNDCLTTIHNKVLHIGIKRYRVFVFSNNGDVTQQNSIETLLITFYLFHNHIFSGNFEIQRLRC